MSNNPPLVSVVVIHYNSQKTLPRALCSVSKQTYKNWECIVVDDGSEADPTSIVERFKDKRFKLIRLGQNQGRGAARQRGLEEARGSYICMVDSDDWIYQNKIQRQVEWLEDNRTVVAVTTSMAILDENHRLSGVRHFCERPVEIFKPLSAARPLPFPHAPTMIRADIAKATKYESQFRMVEDFDFLLKIALNHEIACLRQVFYVYTEFSTLTSEKVINSLQQSGHVFDKYASQYPKAVRFHKFVIKLKCFIYAKLFSLNLYGRLIRARTKRPESLDSLDYHQNREVVESELKRLFPDR